MDSKKSQILMAREEDEEKAESPSLHSGILIVEKDRETGMSYSRLLNQEGFQTALTDSPQQALECLRERRFAAILLNYLAPEREQIAHLKQLLAEENETRVLLLVSEQSRPLALEAIRLGAHQFLQKPFESEALCLAVREAAHAYEIARENDRLRGFLRESSPQQYILGKSPAMQKVWAMVKKVAPSDVPVLIEGETGSGKEVVARAIHQQSLRKDAPFLAVNCVCLSKDLIETELFGHVKGAFTGALANKKGHFEAADGGTLFLDEIGDFAAGLQAKLLRVLQEKSFNRVGDTQSRSINVRILAATNRDLKKAIEDSSFRQDLYYRLNVIHIRIPPLRERREDIPDLIEFFLARLTSARGQGLRYLTPEAVKFLMNYHFPGNVRELANMLERANLLCPEDQIRMEDMLTPISLHKVRNLPLGLSKPPPSDLTNFSEAKAQFEIYHLTRLLALTKGNISQAAKLAGLNRNNFKDKMKKYGLEPTNFKV